MFLHFFNFWFYSILKLKKELQPQSLGELVGLLGSKLSTIISNILELIFNPSYNPQIRNNKNLISGKVEFNISLSKKKPELSNLSK